MKVRFSSGMTKSIMLGISRFRNLGSRIVHRKNFEYEKSKCPDLKMGEVDQALQLFRLNDQNSDVPVVSQLTRHSVILKP